MPAGPNWIHEIKHDGYRLIVRRDGDAVQIITRGGYDWTLRYPLIVRGALALKVRNFTLDGEGVVCGPNGIADFSMLHSRQHDRSVFLYAFDIVEEGGTDIRRLPLHARKDRLATVLSKSADGIVLSEHADDIEGTAMFEAACKMGLEGIVSKRRDKAYASGPCKHWIKVKNPQSPAMLRVVD